MILYLVRLWPSITFVELLNYININTVLNLIDFLRIESAPAWYNLMVSECIYTFSLLSAFSVFI